MSAWYFAALVVSMFALAFGVATWLDRHDRHDPADDNPFREIDLPEIKGEGSSMRVLPPEEQEPDE